MIGGEGTAAARPRAAGAAHGRGLAARNVGEVDHGSAVSEKIMERSASFSPCRRYRYTLWRKWEGSRTSSGYAMFVGLNPSTADETVDDPTVRRCIAFAKAWGYDGLCMTNIFAYRATNPAEMLVQADPVGDENDATLRTMAEGAGLVVAAWGNHGGHRGRGEIVRRMLPNLHYLQLTKIGQPGHPLYLSGKLRPIAWAAAMYL